MPTRTTNTFIEILQRTLKSISDLETAEGGLEHIEWVETTLRAPIVAKIHEIAGDLQPSAQPAQPQFPAGSISPSQPGGPGAGLANPTPGPLPLSGGPAVMGPGGTIPGA